MAHARLKKSIIKDTEEIEENLTLSPLDQIFSKLEDDPDEPSQPPVVQSTREPGKELIDSKYFNGGLSPIIDNYLPPEIQLTAEEKQIVTTGIGKISSGLRASVPITCYGDKCPFARNCPLHKIGKAPVKHDCPIEASLLDVYTKRYLDEFEVDSDLMSEVTTMTMLAATHIMEMRAFTVLGKDEHESPTGLIKNVVGFNQDEEPIVQLQEHPAFNILERAWRWRKNLLESLVGTRKEKYKREMAVGGINPASVSAAAADMRSTIEKLSIIDISED